MRWMESLWTSGPRRVAGRAARGVRRGLNKKAVLQQQHLQLFPQHPRVAKQAKVERARAKKARVARQVWQQPLAPQNSCLGSTMTCRGRCMRRNKSTCAEWHSSTTCTKRCGRLPTCSSMGASRPQQLRLLAKARAQWLQGRRSQRTAALPVGRPKEQSHSRQWPQKEERRKDLVRLRLARRPRRMTLVLKWQPTRSSTAP
mmetsp:Transcript_16172/g.37145  ORF Transcript_16172/g.37145 Transcript_16172/m.37145 type:complete len:201 (-) Transcript_16172:370-972(-)